MPDLPLNNNRQPSSIRPIQAQAASALGQASGPQTKIAGDSYLKPTAPPQIQAKQDKGGKALDTLGVGVAGFVGGRMATSLVDVFFHFGQNGGTSFASPIYWGVAALAAAGAMYLYNRK